MPRLLTHVTWGRLGTGVMVHQEIHPWSTLSPCKVQVQVLLAVQLPANTLGKQQVLTQILAILIPMGADMHGSWASGCVLEQHQL